MFDENKTVVHFIALGNGAKTEYAYDALLRMESLVQTVPGKNAGPEKPAAPETANAFSYDLAGNRTSLASAETKDAGKKSKAESETVSYSSDALNRYVSVSETGKSPKPSVRNFAYDRNGNLLSDEIFRYAYDSRNRLREVRKGRGSEEEFFLRNSLLEIN